MRGAFSEGEGAVTSDRRAHMQGDYIAVVGLGMGAAGAAWATVASQMLSTLAYPVALHLQKKRHLANLVGVLDVKFALGFLSKCLPVMFVSLATLSVYGVMTWAANLQVRSLPHSSPRGVC